MKVLEVKGNVDAENDGSRKWKGCITASIAVPLDRTWQIGSDFSGLHKFVPIVEVCERLKGCNRSPGCLRFYTMNSATGLPGGKRKGWAKDRLLNIDEGTHTFTYAVEGSNMNLENCEVSFTASSSDGNDGPTIVNWAWEVDPVKKSTKEKTLSDMSEFGCTFIKGLEAAAATTDSIDFDFEGAPLDTLTSDGDGDGDGGGDFRSHHPPVPVVSLMKSRLDTLTESLNKISETLEECPNPAGPYHTKLESLHSTLAEGHRSLVSHLHGRMSHNKSIDQSTESIGNRNTSEERYKHYCISSSERTSPTSDASTSYAIPGDVLTPRNSNKSAQRYEHYHVSSSPETMSPKADTSTSKADCEACCRNNPVEVLTPPYVRSLLDKGKAPEMECEASSLGKFPELPSAEELRAIMEDASRGALDAFQDFSNQFHGDLRDDISHHLESVQAQLKAVGFQMQEALMAGVRDGPLTICPNAERLEVGLQESDQTPMLERYLDDPKWSPPPPSRQSPPPPPSYETNLTLSPRSQTPESNRRQSGCWQLGRSQCGRSQSPPPPPSYETNSTLSPRSQTPESNRRQSGCSELGRSQCGRFQSPPPPPSYETNLTLSPGSQTPESNRRQSGCSELDRLRSGRSQGSPQSIYSARFKSRLLFRDLVQDEMSRDSDPRPSLETEVSPKTSEWTCSCPEMTVSDGDSRSGHQHTLRFCYQRSASPHSPKVSDVPTELNSQAQGSDYSGRFRKGQPGDDIDKHTQHLNDVESGEYDHTPNHVFEIRRRTVGRDKQKASLIGLMPDDDTDDSSQKFAYEESSEGVQQDQEYNPPQGWNRRGSKKRQTAQNLEVDIKSLQNSKWKSQEGDPGESGDGEFDGSSNRMRRPSRLPSAIWPNKPPGESGDGEFDGSSNRMRRPNRMPSAIWPNKPPQGESGLQRNSKKVEVQQDGGSGACIGHDLEILEFRQEEILPDSNSPTSSSSSCQNSKTVRKILRLKSNSPQRSPSRRESVPPQIDVGGSSGTSAPTSKRVYEGAKSCSPVSGSYSCASLDQSTGSPLSTGYSSLGQKCSKSCVLLDLKHEIAPGVFRCCQGNQTRVVINIPEHLEARAESRLRPLPLLRKDEIYKEFKLLGIQKPPTEELLLEDFAAARCKKQEEASIFARDMPSKDGIPVYRPYYADGKVWDPNAVPSATVDKSRNGHQTKVKSASGQTAGHSSNIQALTSKKATSQRRSSTSQIIETNIQASTSEKATSQRRSSTSRIIERRPQSEQQSHVTNSSQGDESHTTSDGLREETTAGELAAYDYKSLKGHQSSQRRRGHAPHHESPMQKREIFMKGHGQRNSHVHPSSSSKHKAKAKTGASSLTGTSLHSLATSSRDNTSRELTSMDSGDSFPQEEEKLDENPSSFSTSPVILKKVQAKWLKIKCASVATSPHDDSRKPEENASPRSSLDNSIDNILSHLPQNFDDNQLLDIAFNRDNDQKTSREHSLDEVVHNLPSDSGSSEFDPYRSSGKLGSIAGSSTTGSINTGSGHNFRDQLILGLENGSQLTPTEETINLPDAPLSYSNSDVLHVTTSTETPNITDSPLMSSDAVRTRHCQSCPFGQLKEEVDEVVQSCERGSPKSSDSVPQRVSVRVSWADETPSSQQHSRKSEGEEEMVVATTPSGKSPRALSDILDGMSQDLKDIKAQQSAMSKGTDSQKWGRERRESDERPQKSSITDLRSRSIDRDAASQTDLFSRQSETRSSWRSPRVSRPLSLSGAEGLRTRRSTQRPGSMAKNEAEFVDEQRSYSQILDDAVGKRGERESINSFQARKKRAAEDLAFRTRQSTQMLDSMINVREYDDDSRRYSMWLDGAAQTSLEGNGRRSTSETQTPMDDESAEPWEYPREPRFREDSAANFLGSVKAQILEEFSDSPKSKADANDQSESSNEPRFREDSAGSFLGALSQQIVDQFTDDRSYESQAQGQSEGPTEPRFRERSVLNFLADLSEQLLPEFKNRRTSQTSSGKSEGGREPRFRENSAINFLSALRGQVMERSRQNSELASSIDQNVQSETSRTMPPRYSRVVRGSEDQAYRTQGSNYERDPENQTQLETEAHGDEGTSYQRDPENYAYPGEDRNYQDDPDGQTYPIEDLDYQPDSETQAQQKGKGAYELDRQPYSRENSNYPPGDESQAYPIEDVDYQRDSETQGQQRGGGTYDPDPEGRSYSREGLDYQPDAESRDYPTGGFTKTDQESQNQSFVRPGSCRYSQFRNSQSRNSQLQLGADQLEGQGQGQGYTDEGLNHQPDGEGQIYRAKGSMYQLDPEGQEYPAKGSMYQLDPEGQEYPAEGSIYQLDREGQAYPAEGSIYQLDPEGQAYPGEGYQPDDQPFEPGSVSDQQFETRKSVGYQPSEAESGNSLPDPESQSYGTEGLNYQPDGPMNTMTDQDSRNQSFARSGSRQYSQSRNSQSQSQLGAAAAESRNSRTSSQNAIIDDMLQDMRTTISRSRQNSVSHPGL